MARPRREAKRDSAAPTSSRVLHMDLKVGDRLVDETGDWAIPSHVRYQVRRSDRARASKT
jgi:hypothetical protein